VVQERLARQLAQIVVQDTSGAAPRPTEHATALIPLGHAVVEAVAEVVVEGVEEAAMTSVVQERLAQARAPPAGPALNGAVQKLVEYAIALMRLDTVPLGTDLEAPMASAPLDSLLRPR